MLVAERRAPVRSRTAIKLQSQATHEETVPADSVLLGEGLKRSAKVLAQG